MPSPEQRDAATIGTCPKCGDADVSLAWDRDAKALRCSLCYLWPLSGHRLGKPRRLTSVSADDFDSEGFLLDDEARAYHHQTRDGL